MAIRLLSSESIDGALTLTGSLTGTTATFAGIITANSSVSGDYVRMYGASGTGQWDIYGNGANLRISDNQGAGILAVDRGATFGGTIKIGSGSLTNPSTNADDIVIDNGAGVETGMTFASSVASSIRFGDFTNNSIGSIEYIHTGNHLRFITNGAERVRITGVGNVGIGEDTPLVPLHISRNSISGENIALILDNNNTAASGQQIGMLFRSAAAGNNTDFEIFGLANAANDMDLVFESDGSVERVRFTGDGKVGIGTDSPSNKLSVNGIVGIGSSDQTYLNQTSTHFFMDMTSSTSYFRNTSTAGNGFIFRNSNIGDFEFDNEFAGNIKFNTSNIERLRIDSSGHIGIGITPQTTLADFCSIELGNTGMIMSEKADSQYNSLFLSTNAYYTDAWRYKTASVVGANYISLYRGEIVFATAPAPTTAGEQITWSNKMTLLNNGNFGIGTNDPQRKLQVTNSADGFISRFTGGANSDVNIGLFGHSTSNFGSIGTESDDRFSLYTNGVDRLNIANTGNVGIGVINPETARLLVRGSTNDSTSQIFQAANFGGASKYVIRADGDNKWYKSDNSLSMTINQLGNVGIGVTGPTYPLQVAKNTTNNFTHKIGNDSHSEYVVSGLQDHTVTLECPSYYNGKVIITASQTNGGTSNNIYIEGIWQNNYTTHDFTILHNIGSLSSSTLTTTVSAGPTSTSGRLVVFLDYGSGSFSNMVVRVCNYFSTHTGVIT